MNIMNEPHLIIRPPTELQSELNATADNYIDGIIESNNDWVDKDLVYLAEKSANNIIENGDWALDSVMVETGFNIVEALKHGDLLSPFDKLLVHRLAQRRLLEARSN